MSAAGFAAHRGDDETVSPTGVDVIENLLGGKGAHHLVHQHLEAIDLLALLVLFRLIQSQAQFGPPSAKAVDGDPKNFSGVLAQNLSEHFLGGIGDLHPEFPFSVGKYGKQYIFNNWNVNLKNSLSARGLKNR